MLLLWSSEESPALTASGGVALALPLEPLFRAVGEWKKMSLIQILPNHYIYVYIYIYIYILSCIIYIYIYPFILISPGWLCAMDGCTCTLSSTSPKRTQKNHDLSILLHVAPVFRISEALAIDAALTWDLMQHGMIHTRYYIDIIYIYV